MTDAQTVTWTADKLALLKKAYAAGKDTPVIEIDVKPEGKLEFVPSYAKYLIEYLEGQFARQKPKQPRPDEGEASYVPGSGSWE